MLHSCNKTLHNCNTINVVYVTGMRNRKMRYLENRIILDRKLDSRIHLGEIPEKDFYIHKKSLLVVVENYVLGMLTFY